MLISVACDDLDASFDVLAALDWSHSWISYHHIQQEHAYQTTHNSTLL